jgi:hypothetical protein
MDDVAVEFDWTPLKEMACLFSTLDANLSSKMLSILMMMSCDRKFDGVCLPLGLYLMMIWVIDDMT